MKGCKTFIVAVALFIATAFASTIAFAQTPVTNTYNFSVPNSCGVYDGNYTCSLQIVTPVGNATVNNAFFYEPRWNGNFAYVYFAPGDTVLSDLGFATVDSFNRSLLSSFDNGLRPNTQGYIKWTLYSESTTFHQQNGNPETFTGSTNLQYTTTLRCCSSGRGASAHTTWAVTGGTVTVTK